jgi:hypothetical protein
MDTAANLRRKFDVFSSGSGVAIGSGAPDPIKKMKTAGEKEDDKPAETGVLSKSETKPGETKGKKYLDLYLNQLKCYPNDFLRENMLSFRQMLFEDFSKGTIPHHAN